MWRSTIFFSEPALLFHFRKTEVVTDQGPQQAPAYSKANIVHADFQVEIRFHNAYRAMLIHELVDVCQNYTALTPFPRDELARESPTMCVTNTSRKTYWPSWSGIVTAR